MTLLSQNPASQTSLTLNRTFTLFVILSATDLTSRYLRIFNLSTFDLSKNEFGKTQRANTRAFQKQDSISKRSLLRMCTQRTIITDDIMGKQ